MIETIVILGTGLGISIIRIAIQKHGKKSKKFHYYNYRKYAIRHKKANETVNIQLKNKF